MSGDKIIIFEKSLTYKVKDFLIQYRFHFLIFAIFLIGFSFGVISTVAKTPDKQIAIGENSLDSMVKLPFNPISEEKPSPFENIKENQIHVYNDKVMIDLENAEWATFTDTNSMDPVFDKGNYAIEIIPKTSDEIRVGDIVSYKSQFADGTIIHRVVEIGNDENGWFARFKGDNNSAVDPGKVRFSQIQRVVVAIIY